eukprot:14393779-Alexandrium_andersonii.AAC.1
MLPWGPGSALCANLLPILTKTTAPPAVDPTTSRVEWQLLLQLQSLEVAQLSTCLLLSQARKYARTLGHT